MNRVSHNTWCWGASGGLGDNAVTCLHQGSCKTFVTYCTCHGRMLSTSYCCWSGSALPPSLQHLSTFDSHHKFQNTMGNDFNSAIAPLALAVQRGVPSVREGICQWTKGRGHFDNPPDQVHGHIQTESSLNGEHPVKLQCKPSIHTARLYLRTSTHCTHLYLSS